MMRRILCFLLTTSLLASQSFCWAHAHIQSESARGGEHSARPHVHIGGHDSHVHRHDQHVHKHRASADPLTSLRNHEADRPLSDGMLPNCDHDSDAVYFGTADGFPGIVTVASSELVLTCKYEQLFIGNDDAPPRVATARAAALFDLGLTCPLYLRKLSLRL